MHLSLRKGFHDANHVGLNYKLFLPGGANVMRNMTTLSCILSVTLLAGILANPAAAGEDESLGLVSWMGRLQYYAHKLGLAVDAENRALQGYHVHEVEEVIEQLEEIKEAGGVEIGNLVKVKLVPAFETLEGAVEVGDQAQISLAYDGLLAACNTCHKAANRPYLHIVRRNDNPYLQDFSPTP